MSLTGEVCIRARLIDDAVRVEAVNLRRPPVSRLLVGRLPTEIAKALPMLYALCGHAQSMASQAALMAAAGALSADAEQGIELASTDSEQAWFEFLHESVWRLLLDWPVTVGMAPLQQAFVAWRQARQQGLDALCDATQSLLEKALPTVCAAVESSFPEAAVATSSALPDTLDGMTWDQPAGVATAFARRVAWTRAAAAGLCARKDYPLWAGVLSVSGQTVGVGRTLTSRGLLEHRVVLQAGRSTQYEVWAPTDVCFADTAALQANVQGVKVDSQVAAERWMQQAVLALDPCVPFSVEWLNA